MDFDQYYESMRRLSEVEYEVLCLGHRQALSGQDANNYFPKSMTHCREFLNLVESSLVKEGGNVQKVELIKGIGAGCDEVAMDAVRATKFKPGKQRGKAVRVQVSIPILFRLQ